MPRIILAKRQQSRAGRSGIKQDKLKNFPPFLKREPLGVRPEEIVKIPYLVKVKKGVLPKKGFYPGFVLKDYYLDFLGFLDEVFPSLTGVSDEPLLFANPAKISAPPAGVRS